MASDDDRHQATKTPTPGPPDIRKNRDDATENTPLLASSVEVGQVGKRRLGRWSTATCINIILVALLLTSCGDSLAEYSNVRIFESIICYRFYEKQDPALIRIGRDRIGPGAIGGVDEMWCKADPVAAELASLLGNQAFFDGLPNLLLCLPAGWAADKVGRLPFLLLGVVGLPLRAAWMQLVMYNWQAFDVQWSWLSAVFLLPAGGSYFTTSILYIICSDITEPTERASVFFRLGAVNISASLLMPPLAAWLMGFTPWIPAFLGLGLSVSCFLVCLSFPETLHYRQPDASVPPDDEPLMDLDSGWTSKVRGSVHFLTRDWRVPALITSFFIHVPIAAGTQLLLQYISKRYSLRLSQATLFITIREAVHVALLFLILPYLQTVFLRILNNSGLRKDLYLTRMSLVFTTAGILLTGVSPNVPILVIGLVLTALGSGASFVTRSFLTQLCPPHHVARMFALIGVVSGVAQLSAAPLLAELFKSGMKLGSAWMGLPYIFIGVSSTALTVLLFCMQLRESEKTSPDDSGGADPES